MTTENNPAEVIVSRWGRDGTTISNATSTGGLKACSSHTPIATEWPTSSTAAVARAACDEGVGRPLSDDEIDSRIAD